MEEKYVQLLENDNLDTGEELTLKAFLGRQKKPPNKQIMAKQGTWLPGGEGSFEFPQQHRDAR